jgi:hypothetical protein
MKGELSMNQINNLLSSQVIGRLACCDGKFPYIIPMTYTYDGEYIFGQTNEGRKLDIMRKNPNVAFQVDSCLDIFNWQSVIVYGQFEEINDDEGSYAKNILVKKVMPLMTESCVHHHEHSLVDEKDTLTDNRFKLTFFKISINEKTGRFERQ